MMANTLYLCNYSTVIDGKMPHLKINTTVNRIL